MKTQLLTFALLVVAVAPAGHAQDRKASPDRRANPFAPKDAPDTKDAPAPKADTPDDRGPRTVTVEVVIADVQFKKDAAAEDLSGPDALAKVAGLAKAGQSVVLQRVSVTALEGGPVKVQSGVSKPYTTAQAFGGGGGRQPVVQNVSYRDGGTTLTFTARPAPDGGVLLDLAVQASGMRDPAVDKDGAAVAPTFETLSVSSRVHCRADGKPVVAHAMHGDTPAGRSATVVVVTAKAAK